MKIQSIPQHTYKSNSNPNFKMILDREATKGLHEAEMDKLAKLIKNIGPKCQKVGFRILVPKEPNDDWMGVEIVSGDYSVRGQVKFNGSMEAIADVLTLKYKLWRRDINNILKSLKFDNINLITG